MVRDILSPVKGVISEINPSLDAKPEVMNSDPYDDGWVAVIKSDSNMAELLSAEDYLDLMKKRVAEELRKIKGL